ncbi:MAG: hypothetical protein R6X02_34425 [Enhygromyxa sp.]
MEVGSPEWIEASLAKLDKLERERDEHEAALESASDPATLGQHNAAVERLDAEIKALYAQLEAVAGEEEEQDEEDDDVVPRSTQADDELSAPHVSAEPTPAPAAAENPFGGAAGGAAENPFGGSGGGFDAPAPMAFDDDFEPKGGGAKWAVIGLVVVAGIGIGGYFAWQNMQAQKAKEQATPDTVEEIKIEAAQIREDTEAPNAVKGGDATISPTADGYPSGKSGGSGGGGGGGGKKSDPKKTKPLKLTNTDDPLG